MDILQTHFDEIKNRIKSFLADGDVISYVAIYAQISLLLDEFYKDVLDFLPVR